MTRARACEILGVSLVATLKEIKATMRKKAKQTHPDVGGTNQEFNEVMSAYKFLTRPPAKSKIMSDSYANFQWGKEAQRTESWFSKKLKVCLEAHGIVVNIHGHGMQRAGVPDFYVAALRFHGWLELKIDNGKLSALQKSFIGKLRKQFVPAFIVRYQNKDIYIEDHDDRVIEIIEDFQFTADGAAELLLVLKDLTLYGE